MFEVRRLYFLTETGGASGEKGEKMFHRKAPGEAAGVRLPPVCLNQAVVLTRDLTSHSSTASRSATSSQPQIMARVWAVRLWPVVIM